MFNLHFVITGKTGINNWNSKETVLTWIQCPVSACCHFHSPHLSLCCEIQIQEFKGMSHTLKKPKPPRCSKKCYLHGYHCSMQLTGDWNEQQNLQQQQQQQQRWPDLEHMDMHEYQNDCLGLFQRRRVETIARYSQVMTNKWRRPKV